MVPAVTELPHAHEWRPNTRRVHRVTRSTLLTGSRTLVPTDEAEAEQSAGQTNFTV